MAKSDPSGYAPQPPPPSPPCPPTPSGQYDLILLPRLRELLELWDRRCANKFRWAEQEASEFGRRFIRHGAVNMYNCAYELRCILDGRTEDDSVTEPAPVRLVNRA